MPFHPKRLGVDDLTTLLDDSLVVQHIAEPLLCCNATDDVRSVERIMAEKNFDLLGVIEDGHIVGYIRRGDLTDNQGRQRIIRFGSMQIVASRTPLIDFLPLLKTRPTYFVLDRTEIKAVVNRADLQKWPVRMLLFGLVSTLEMYLLKMVRVCYPGDSFLTRLSTGRAEKTKALFDERRKRDEDIDFADCLQMSDKVDLLFKTDGLTSFLELTGGGPGKKYFREVEALRNKLAHAQDLTLGTLWEEVIEIAGSVETLLRRCEQSWEEFVAKFGPQDSVEIGQEPIRITGN